MEERVNSTRPQCSAISNTTGMRCLRPALIDKDKCQLHDPALAKRRSAWNKRGADTRLGKVQKRSVDQEAKKLLKKVGAPDFRERFNEVVNRLVEERIEKILSDLEG